MVKPEGRLLPYCLSVAKAERVYGIGLKVEP